MLRFRYGPSIPPGAANLAYISVPIASPKTHLGLTDYSADIPENIVDNYGDEISPVVQPSGDPALTPEYVDTDKFVISNKSVVSKNVTKPTKLYYVVTLGQSGAYNLYDEEASASDLNVARDIIRKHIKLIDRDNNPVSDIGWDIEVTGAGSSAKSFVVRIYLEKKGLRDQTLIAQYYAISTAGVRSPNFREVLNPTPVLISGTDYTVVDKGTLGFEIQGLATSNLAPAIALFGPTATAVVTTTNIQLAGGNSVTLQAGGVYRPVADIVADINALDVDVAARALSDHVLARLRTGTYTITTYGLVLRFDRNTHVRYEESRRIRALLPDARNAIAPWYPRISKGSFTIDLSDPTGPYRYDIRDFDYQVFNTTYGPPYKDAALEQPTLIGSKKLKLEHLLIKSKSDVTIYIDGVQNTTILDQIDLQNGILFLTKDIHPDQNILVSYVYEDSSFIYQNVNLNPTLKHNQEVLGDYIGIYLIPRKYLGAGLTFEKTVYHMTRGSAREIEDEIPTLKLSDGVNAQAKLLGIFRIVQTETPNNVEIVDTRSYGGGLREDIDPSEVTQPETEFYTDLGAHYNGKPYPDAGTIIIEIPEKIPGTGQVDSIHTIYESMGVTAGPVDSTGWVNPTGLLTKEEIYPKLHKYADAGTLIIEDYY